MRHGVWMGRNGRVYQDDIKKNVEQSSRSEMTVRPSYVRCNALFSYEELFPTEAKKFRHDDDFKAKSVEDALDARVKKKLSCQLVYHCHAESQFGNRRLWGKEVVFGGDAAPHHLELVDSLPLMTSGFHQFD
ncbi:hypothetical protein ACFE04_027740 [Oxalis oulophora]